MHPVMIGHVRWLPVVFVEAMREIDGAIEMIAAQRRRAAEANRGR